MTAFELHPVSLAADGDPGATVQALVCGRVRALAERRRAWLAQATGGASAARDDRAARAWSGGGSDAEWAWYATSPEAQPLTRTIERQTELLAGERGSRLDLLCRILELDAAERHLLEVCWAVVLDPELTSLFAVLPPAPGDGQPSERLAASLFGHALPLIAEAGALLRWRLVTRHDGGPGEVKTIEIDPAIAAFLDGSDALDPGLVEHARRLERVEPLADWPVAATADRIARALATSRQTRLLVLGRPRTGRRTFAGCVAHALGSATLAIDANEIPEADWSRVYVEAQRYALLHGLVPVWSGRDVARRTPRLPRPAPIEVITAEPDAALPAAPDAADERVALPGLTIDQRRHLWLRLVPAARAWPAPELEQLVERYRISIGDLAAIARTGIDSVDEARTLCREATRHRLGDLGQLLDCPFVREDLLVPPALDRTLDDFLFEARARGRFWEDASARRLFPRGRGLVGLMTGPPGTGKTMAAQIIAGELGLDLVRIDLASCLSKYIGETAKNLRRIFASSADTNTVLLFDEADALFSKRTDVRDAHDRYANTDTNYLLQLVEDFDGVALLTSNQRHNMDSAFIRRIRYVFDFPRPGPRERLLIWQRLVRELAGDEREQALRASLTGLAAKIDISGAQIKLSLLAALFAARRDRRPLHIEHLYHGLNHELGKEGRAIGPKERDRIEGSG